MKVYKVTYKTYFNERLNKVRFHSRDTYPLYVQVTFDRKSIFFKSYYFDLLQQPRHVTRYVSDPLGKIKAKEEQLIEFIINKNAEDFTLERFSADYRYYSTDLPGLMEAAFKDYLFHFFNDEGVRTLASMMRSPAAALTVEALLQDFKLFLKPALYDKLLENATYYAPPLLPLDAFIHKLHPNGLFCLPVFEWLNPQVQTGFEEFLNKHYPLYDKATVKERIERYIETIPRE